MPLDTPVIVEEIIPPTTNFAKSNGDLPIQTCLRCNSVLNPAAKFCSVCGRASDPTAFERTIDATRSARGRATAAARRTLQVVADRLQIKDSSGFIPLIFLGLSLLCFLVSFFLYPFFVPERPEVQTVVQQVRSLWWLGFGTLLMAVAAFFKR
jgi:hypothetical protein